MYLLCTLNHNTALLLFQPMPDISFDESICNQFSPRYRRLFVTTPELIVDVGSQTPAKQL